jgi:hypothetical protein
MDKIIKDFLNKFNGLDQVKADNPESQINQEQTQLKKRSYIDYELGYEKDVVIT